MSAAGPLLALSGLSLDFVTRGGRVRALDRVGFEIAQGEMLGVVGESGSGKSVTAYAVMDLLEPAARIGGGRLDFRGLDLLGADRARLAALRGQAISMIFQNPRAALNPIRPVGRQLVDVLRAHRPMNRAAAESEAERLLAMVRIPDPARRMMAYPFELSGGLCQRAMIALALACQPALLIADEPTTGLDVTTQAAIMDLLRDLARARGMATLFITHDLALAGDYCDRIAVMHAGQVVECAPTARLLAEPRHPYTRGLLAATPRSGSRIGEIAAVGGALPDLTREDLPPCRYAERCERRRPECDAAPPPLAERAPGHAVACWRAA
ncbi:MAG: ABC transporter ATP-binding protein [Alphaproteobacteria bacterium]|nr:ABC transporter ATP-binding protein [Alphaproteobacteria bacterium]